MRIFRSGRTSDAFSEELEKLAKKMPGSDKHIDQRLGEHRDIRSHAHEGGTEEAILAGDRKNDKTIGEQLTEENLRDHGADSEVEVITEKQLEDAPKKDKYPHRNAKAHERTGEKRQVNALDEEMGNAGDASKVDRYEKANKPGGKRVLDKDVGSQLTNEKTKIKNAGSKTRAFNLKQHKNATACGLANDYLKYRKRGPYNRKFAEAEKLDLVMSEIMKFASQQKRELTDDEKAKVVALKSKKSELLRVSGDY